MNKDQLEERKISVSLQHVRGTSENIHKVLKKFYINQSIIVFLTKLHNINQPVNVVYKLSCSECSGIYNGQTNQYLDRRIKNHLKNIRNSKPETPVLAEHTLRKNHKFEYYYIILILKSVRYI